MAPETNNVRMTETTDAPSEGVKEFFAYGTVIFRVLGPVLLGEVGDFEPFAANDLAFVGLLGLRENAKEGGLAGAVGADEAGFLAFE